MSEVMECLIDKLTNKLRAKAIFKKMSLTQIDHMLEAAVEVKAIKIEEELAHQKMVNSQAEAIAKATALLAEAGIVLNQDDLTADVTAAKKIVKKAAKKATKREPSNQNKYKVTDKKGNVRFWSGHGHMPVQLKEIMEKSRKVDRLSKKSFLVGHDFQWSHVFSNLHRCNEVEVLKTA